jgi:transposase
LEAAGLEYLPEGQLTQEEDAENEKEPAAQLPQLEAAIDDIVPAGQLVQEETAEIEDIRPAGHA